METLTIQSIDHAIAVATLDTTANIFAVCLLFAVIGGLIGAFEAAANAIRG